LLQTAAGSLLLASTAVSVTSGTGALTNAAAVGAGEGILMLAPTSDGEIAAETPHGLTIVRVAELVGR
jgi:hypothetical protein